jgi:hypothetical protein
MKINKTAIYISATTLFVALGVTATIAGILGGGVDFGVGISLSKIWIPISFGVALAGFVAFSVVGVMGYRKKYDLN